MDTTLERRDPPKHRDIEDMRSEFKKSESSPTAVSNETVGTDGRSAKDWENVCDVCLKIDRSVRVDKRMKRGSLEWNLVRTESFQ